MNYYAFKKGEGNIAVDDTILVKDMPAACGSKILEGFKPLFSAEAVTRLENKGYKISGKTHVGEFGLDLVGEFSHYEKQEGTLKGAAASLVKEGSVKAALGVDQNGAPRRSAALLGIDFLKPTYGTVSRYGIISCAASGEQLGVYAPSAQGIKEIMEVISGHDEIVGTSLKNESYDYLIKSVSGKKVCVIKELLDLTDDKTKENITSYIEKLKENGVEVNEISFDIFETANMAWQILSTAETCNNISRYDGVKYGHRAENYKDIDELYVNSRTEGFNLLTKTVILYGSDVLSKNRYEDTYNKSLKVRRVMKEKFENLMKEYDAVITPVCSKESFESYDIKDAFVKVFEEGVFTSLANLIGVPALTTCGVQLIGKYFDESTLLSLADALEKEGK